MTPRQPSPAVVFVRPRALWQGPGGRGGSPGHGGDLGLGEWVGKPHFRQVSAADTRPAPSRHPAGHDRASRPWPLEGNLDRLTGEERGIQPHPDTVRGHVYQSDAKVGAGRRASPVHFGGSPMPDRPPPGPAGNLSGWSTGRERQRLSATAGWADGRIHPEVGRGARDGPPAGRAGEVEEGEGVEERGVGGHGGAGAGRSDRGRRIGGGCQGRWAIKMGDGRRAIGGTGQLPTYPFYRPPCAGRTSLRREFPAARPEPASGFRRTPLIPIIRPGRRSSRRPRPLGRRAPGPQPPSSPRRHPDPEGP